MSARVLHIKYLSIFSLRFWQHTLFLWQRNFYWFFQIKSFCMIIFGSINANASVELENSVPWRSLMLYFLFVSSIALFSSRRKWLSYLSHAISPYLHGRLINWTSMFYLSICCTVLPRILNKLIFMNRVFSIICICLLDFRLFHM